MTLDKPLHYVTSTCILPRTGLRFYTNLHTNPKPTKFFSAIIGDKFCVDIDNNAIRYFSGFFFIFYYSVYISPCNLVLAVFCV